MDSLRRIYRPDDEGVYSEGAIRILAVRQVRWVREVRVRECNRAIRWLKRATGTHRTFRTFRIDQRRLNRTDQRSRIAPTFGRSDRTDPRQCDRTLAHSVNACLGTLPVLRAGAA